MISRKGNHQIAVWILRVLCCEGSLLSPPVAFKFQAKSRVLSLPHARVDERYTHAHWPLLRKSNESRNSPHEVIGSLPKICRGSAYKLVPDRHFCFHTHYHNAASPLLVPRKYIDILIRYKENAQYNPKAGTYPTICSSEQSTALQCCFCWGYRFRISLPLTCTLPVFGIDLWAAVLFP